MIEENHTGYMQQAIIEAKKAAKKEEVPVGAVAVLDGKIVARAHNIREKTKNPLGHAEILLIERLAKKKKSWRLTDAVVYVTCEPCLMCTGALLQARIPKLVYGCRDPKGGACTSLHNHTIEIIGGILEEDCAKLLIDFFSLKRGGE